MKTNALFPLLFIPTCEIQPYAKKGKKDPSYHLIYVLSPFEEIKNKKCIIIIPFYKIHKIEPREKKTLKQTSITDRLKREGREIERKGREIERKGREIEGKGEGKRRERREREGRERGREICLTT